MVSNITIHILTNKNVRTYFQTKIFELIVNKTFTCKTVDTQHYYEHNKNIDYFSLRVVLLDIETGKNTCSKHNIHPRRPKESHQTEPGCGKI